MYVYEFVIAGLTIVSCAGAWVVARNHELNAELQMHKITTDYKMLQPQPEPRPLPKEPTIEEKLFQQQTCALEALIDRRRNLQEHILQIQERLSENLKSIDISNLTICLDRARALDKELMHEQNLLFKMMMQQNDQTMWQEVRLDTSEKPLQPDSGGSMAPRVADFGDMRVDELHDAETSRKNSS